MAKISLEQCLEVGFTNGAYVKLDTLTLLPEIRDMCADNKCGKYNTCWSCPPACGTLEDLQENLKTYDYGYILQVTGQMEDSFDYETIQRVEQDCNRFLDVLVPKLRTQCTKVHPMRVGTCKLCQKCAYPDAPCRFPEDVSPSMEAHGLWVSKECEKANLPYYYGPNTMTFVVMVLIKE